MYVKCWRQGCTIDINWWLHVNNRCDKKKKYLNPWRITHTVKHSLSVSSTRIDSFLIIIFPHIICARWDAQRRRRWKHKASAMIDISLEWFFAILSLIKRKWQNSRHLRRQMAPLTVAEEKKTANIFFSHREIERTTFIYTDRWFGEYMRKISIINLQNSIDAYL